MRSIAKAIAVSALPTLLASASFADQACLDEADAVQAILTTPPAGLVQADLDEAFQLLNRLMIACQEGSALSDGDVQSVASRLRFLLGME